MREWWSPLGRVVSEGSLEARVKKVTEVEKLDAALGMLGNESFGF